MKGKCLCEELNAYLNAHDGQRATVHSTYKKAINLVDERGSFVAILREDTDMEPMSLLVEDDAQDMWAIKMGETVLFSKEGILFEKSNVWVCTKEACLWNPHMILSGTQKCFKEKETACEELKEILCEKDMEIGLSPLVKRICYKPSIKLKDFYKPPLNAYCDFVQNRFVRFLTYLEAQDFESALEIVPKFVGFGPGLTPSSDDVLAGIIAVISYFSALSKDQKLWERAKGFSQNVYKISLGKTTKVSEQMLMHAVKGKFPESYRNLMRSLIFKKQKSIKDTSAFVLKHGASSGSDFLLGVYSMESIVLNMWLQSQRD